MKKQALRAVTMLVSIIVLAFATAVASNAQSRSPKLKADIPFAFTVGDRVLSAGTYTVGQITSASDDGLLIRSRDGHQKAIRLTNLVLAGKAKKRAMLTFHRYGDTYYLAQVWVAGSREGREMVKSKAERSAEREQLARVSSQNNVAQAAGPEVVTIMATVE
jgi:hypothetical protein